MADDMILDENWDLTFKDGDFAVGESTVQEVATILQLTQGDLKSDPVLGPNLVQLLNAKIGNDEFRRRVKIHLARDGKDYNDMKNLINIKEKVL